MRLSKGVFQCGSSLLSYDARGIGKQQIPTLAIPAVS